MKYGLKLFVWMAAATALAACSLTLPAQAPSSATSTPDILLGQTPTPAPTITFTPLPPTSSPTGTKTQFPTITPIPTETMTPSLTPLGGGPTPTPQFACELVEKYPDNWMEIKTNTNFEARWKVKNSGTTSWRPTRVVLKYISGVKMHIGKVERRHLTAEIAPGSELLQIVEMRAPKAKGDYATTWGLVEVSTGKMFCGFTAKIIAK